MLVTRSGGNMRYVPIIAALLWSSTAAAFVAPNFDIDNDDPILVPLLHAGLFGVQLGLESGTFDCDCMPLADSAGGGFAIELSYDRGVYDHVAWRASGRFGEKVLSYASDRGDAHVELLAARLHLGLSFYASPWDYFTVMLGLGGFASMILDVEGRVGGQEGGAYSRRSDYARGEAGVTGGLILAFSPGRGRSWMWSLAVWADQGLTDIGDPPAVAARKPETPLHSTSITVLAGVHF